MFKKFTAVYVAILLQFVWLSAYAVVIQGETTPGVYTNVAVDSTGTMKSTLSDGTTSVNNLAGDPGQNAQLVAGSRKEITFSTTSVAASTGVDTSNYSSVSVHITSQGTSSTVTFQASNDNSNWVNTALVSATTSNNSVVSMTTTGVFYGTLSARYFRLNVTGISSGTTTAIIEFFSASKTVTQGITGSVSQSGTWTVGVNAITTGGYSFNNITTAATTTVKSGAGTLHSITVNTKGVTATATIYDNTAGSGTKIGTVDLTFGTESLIYDAAFSTGLTVVTTGGTPADITVNYK